MLAVQLQVDRGDRIRVGHIVVGVRAGQPMAATAVFLTYADGGIDRHVRDMHALGHELARHALRQTGLAMTGCRKGAA